MPLAWRHLQLTSVQWPFGAVKGHWNISSQENGCTPLWGKFTDKVRLRLALEYPELTSGFSGQGCIKKDSQKRVCCGTRFIWI